MLWRKSVTALLFFYDYIISITIKKTGCEDTQEHIPHNRFNRFYHSHQTNGYSCVASLAELRRKPLPS